MLIRPTGDIKDDTTRQHIEHLQAEAQGNIIILSAVPTASAPLLQAGEIGQYGTSFYCRVGEVIYVFASSSQITIT